MKAVAVRQPEITRLAAHEIRIDVKTWRTDYRGPILLVRVSQHVCRCMHPAVGPPYRRPQRCGCDQGCIDDLFYPPEFRYRSPFSSTRCRLSWM